MAKGLYYPINKKKYMGNKNCITWRSRWEFTMMRRFDDDPKVIRWASEGIVIPYRSPVDGRIHRYYPDFYVEQMKDGRLEKVIIEVKPFKESVRPVRRPKQQQRTFINECKTYMKNQAKWAAAEEFCEQHGIVFQVMTEREIYGG